jgi:CRP-like cAMP-binding protein
MIILTDEEKKQILRNTKMFATATDGILEQVIAGLRIEEVPAGEPIMVKGEWGSSMYAIAKGSVRVHDGELVYNYLDTGDVFGEMAALDPEVRSASITAIEDTTLARLDQSTLRDIMAGHFEVVQMVIHVLCVHLRNRLDDMTRDFRYIQQVNQLTAAASAIEAGDYQLEDLDRVTQRPDELGQLARVFKNMARQVYNREQELRQQVLELRIEIDKNRQNRQVTQITSTDYFRQLQSKASSLRSLFSDEDDEKTQGRSEP